MNSKKIIINITFLIFIIGIISFLLFSYDEKYFEADSSIYAIMLEKEDGTYLESDITIFPTEGYTFNSELSYCVNGSTLEYDSNLNQMKINTTGSEKCFVYFDKETTALQLLSLHSEINGLIQHTPEKITSAGDNNYRYSGGSDVVNNYVCFGSDEAVCPKENLYRILGIYNIDGEQRVKLIKAHPIDKNNNGEYIVDLGHEDTFVFDVEEDNRWEGANDSIVSDDADINLYLNGEYYNNITSKYQEMIQESKYSIGGVNGWPTYQTYKAKDFYSEEITAQTVNEYKIGLINASDYLYGASEEYWDLINYEINEPHNDSYYSNVQSDENWLFLDEYKSQNYREWTMNYSSNTTYVNGGSNSVSSVNYFGYVYYSKTYHGFVTRPVFYLKSSVRITSGTGTELDPFRIIM